MYACSKNLYAAYIFAGIFLVLSVLTRSHDGERRRLILGGDRQLAFSFFFVDPELISFELCYPNKGMLLISQAKYVERAIREVFQQRKIKDSLIGKTLIWFSGKMINFEVGNN